MQIADCKSKIRRGGLQIGIACVFALISNCAAVAANFSFDDIEFWVGTGANRSAVVIDWVENSTDPSALAWGYRWEGAAKGRDMLTAIVAADPRLFAKLGGTAANPVVVYGFGYDADGDGEFGIDDETSFDESGIVFGSAPFFPAAATDVDDYYAEGWTFAFWHYGTASNNPFDGGSWLDGPTGMASRDLADGSWDSWVYSPTFNFASFATNPRAAPSPFPPGDFNADGHVDAGDYDVWRTTFGSATQPAADANHNGIVDAADYVIWRNHFTATAMASSASPAAYVPEPTSVSVMLVTILFFQFAFRREPLMVANRR